MIILHVRTKKLKGESGELRVIIKSKVVIQFYNFDFFKTHYRVY